MIRKILIPLFSIFSITSFAQVHDTTTIIIYDSLSHTYKRVVVSEHEYSDFIRKITTQRLDDIAQPIRVTYTEEKYQITSDGRYRYNYDGFLVPVTELTFYYKIVEDGLLPDTVDALRWLNAPIKEQKRMLAKYSRTLQ